MLVDFVSSFEMIFTSLNTHAHNRFAAIFPGPPRWAVAGRELLDFMVQGKINRGRHTNHPAGRHSIRTNQCPPPPSPPYFLQAGCPSCRPTNSVKALKATGAFRLGRRRWSSPHWCYLHRLCATFTSLKWAIVCYTVTAVTFRTVLKTMLFLSVPPKQQC